MVGTSAKSSAYNINFEFKHNLQESSAHLDRSAREEIVPFTTTTSP
jgi:hypothetical protein